MNKPLPKGAGIAQFEKDPLHANYESISKSEPGQTGALSAESWALLLHDPSTMHAVPDRLGSDGTQLVTVQGPVGKVTDRSQSVLGQYRFTTQENGRF